jgi:DNA mismatch endonuclease (patch repair protein)
MFSKTKRSEIMSRIRSKNTLLDLAMKTVLRNAGIKFKMYPNITGNPDFLIGKRLVVFCDSAFWHGRNWNKLRARLERGSNASYWVTHILENRRRDRWVNTELKRLGYVVLRFWDEEVYNRPGTCLKTIIRAMRPISGADTLTGRRSRGSRNL